MKNPKNDPLTQLKLVPGEQINFGGSLTKTDTTDEDINARYAKGDIRIVTESARYSLAGILNMLKEKVPDPKSAPELRYKLDPEYQRRHRWSDERKSRLIESFLMNVPVPPIFLYERDLARYEVMDGRQRLTALSEFYDNKFKLTGLQYWAELEGRTYEQLPSKVRDGIDRRYISSIILLKETASTNEQATHLKKMVFERLNSGGVALSNQETRNAVYDGRLNQLCLQLSKSEDFRSMWKIPSEPVSEPEKDEDTEEQDTPTKSPGQKMYEKMEDVELVLRFFAYRQIESLPNVNNKIATFLDKFLNEGNNFGNEIISMYESLFKDTISLLSKTLGEHAFCRIGANGKPSARPTKILYDPLMYIASQYSQGKHREVLINGRLTLIEELQAMFKQDGNLFGGRRTGLVDIRKRNECLMGAFQSTLKRLNK